MKNFPRMYVHPSNREMPLDETRLLLTFQEAVNEKESESVLKDLGLTIDHGDEADSQRKLRGGMVNNSDTRLFVRSVSGEPISDDTLAKLVEKFKKNLLWAGPVYRSINPKGGFDGVAPSPNILLLRVASNAERSENTVKKLTAAHGLSEVKEKSKYLNGLRYFEMKDISGTNALSVRDALMKQDQSVIEAVLLEHIPYYLPLCVNPNDTFFANQWDMTQIQAPAAWDISTGTNTVVVAVLDTGCDLTHPDLQFVSPGIDLGDMTSDGSPNAFGTVTGHGTCCAGIVAASFNNSEGISGVAGSCRILPIAFRTFADTEVVAGINFAAANGAFAISMSFGQYAVGEGAPSGWNFAIIDTALQNASSAGLVLCAATGNENRGDVNRYPAKNGLTMACGASSTDDNRKSTTSPDPENFWGSNFGQENYNGITTGVSVVAPGVLIPSTDIQGTGGFNTTAGAAGNYFMTFNGTSSATPHVAGLAALIRSRYPTLNNLQVRNIIEKTANKSGTVAYADQPGFNNGTRNQQMGYGRINAFRGLDNADVMIKDWSGDDGVEPSNPPGGNFWDFSDIVVRINDDNVFNPSNPSQSKNVERGQRNFIYVQVTNRGPKAARNVVVDCRITPWIGLQFRYPDDWTLNDTMHFAPTALNNTFSNIAPGSSVRAKFRISAAQTEILYGWENSNPWHPCLLARVLADNDYAFATASFGADPLSRLRNNLAQRNLTVIDVLALASPQMMAFPFVAGHLKNLERFMELKIQQVAVIPGVRLLLNLDDTGRAFPAVDFTRTEDDQAPVDGDKGLVFMETTRIETTLGCCRGILTVVKGSRFDCAHKKTLDPIEVKGGEIIIREGKRYVELRELVTSVRVAKEPGSIYPLSIAFEIPGNTGSENELQFRVSQADAQGNIVGGATAIYYIK